MFDRVIGSLEQFLHTDVRYLAKGSFWLLIGRGSGALIAFALSILYARYLPKELYGDYRYILGVLGAFGIFALPGIATVITRGVARGFEGTFLRGSRLIFFSSFTITVLGFITAGLFFFQGNVSLAWGFIIAGLLTPFSEGLGNWRAYFDGLRRFREKTFWNIIANFFQGFMMVGAVASVFFLKLSPALQIVMLVGAFYISHALPNVMWHIYTRRRIAKEAVSEPGALRYGLKLSLLDAPSTIANYLDGILLYMFLGPAALAVYAFAIAPPEQLKGLLGTIASVGLPKLSVRTKDDRSLRELRITLPRKIFRATFFTFVLVGAYIIAAPFLYTIFFPRYYEAALFSQAFAASLLLFPFSFFHTAILTEGNLKKVYWDKLGWPLVHIATLLVLVPFFGIWGAVIAKIIGRLFNHLVSLVLFMYY